MVDSRNSKGINSNKVKSDEKLYYLDIGKPRIVQPIDPKDGALESYRFVEVEVAEVHNPKRHPVTFQVHYQTKNNEKLYLGSFSLYPSDNPGKFIVATQGKLRSEGAIVLSLVIPNKVETGSKVKVGVKRIRFLKG